MPSSSYLIRYGHERYKKATKHLAVKAAKRAAAIARNAIWTALTVTQKLKELEVRPGYSHRQIARLTEEK